MKIYIGRHAEAEPASVDVNQGLTANGLMQADQMGQYLAELSVRPDQILHSVKARTRETAQIYAKHLDVHHVTECDTLLKEGMSISPLLDMIAVWKEDVLLVGHLPFIAKLLNALVLGDEQLGPLYPFPLGGLVCVERVSHERWVMQWAVDPMIIV